MRIACLQFAPQVADVDNNLNRADSVLAKANPDDLEGLDLLVLPELAFTGYKFDSLQHISPYLEHAGSGISSLWARTTALRLNTTVVVGYPEKVDVSLRWPTSPEYYNSSIIIDRDGQTIANYRKSFLYAIDETWALEGRDGFFKGDLPGLGRTAMGICMDLNPYKFEAPWHAFEFGFHIIEVQANLVIVNMAWLTRDEVRVFSRMPLEPDMETLTYWVQRLEPVIRAESENEIIVVFCNRTGFEDDAVYAGTSAVLGILDGEVNVYGILGRGVKDLLVVDTDDAPFAKLVQRSGSIEAAPVADRHRRLENEIREKVATATTLTEPSPAVDCRQRSLAPTPTSIKKTKKSKPVPACIRVPEKSHPRQYPVTNSTPVESPGIATPTCPSPTPLSDRPMINFPASAPHENISIKQSLRHGLTEENLRAWAAQSPIDQQVPRTECPGSEHLTEKYLWLPTQTALKSPMEMRFPQHYPPPSPTAVVPIPSSLIRIPQKERHSTRSPLALKDQSSSKPARSGGSDHSGRVGRRLKRTQDLEDGIQPEGSAPLRPYSPKSRNASRTGRPLDPQASELEQPDLSEMTNKLAVLARRPASAMESRPSDFVQPRRGKPPSPSRTASHTRPRVEKPQLEGRAGGKSGTGNPLTDSPGVFYEDPIRSRSDMFSRTRGTFEQGNIRSCPRAGAQSRNRSLSGAGMRDSHLQSGSASRGNTEAITQIESDETRTIVWSELSKIVGEVLDRPQSGGASRGRQHVASSTTAAGGPEQTRATRSESRGPQHGSRTRQLSASRGRRGAAGSTNMKTSPGSNGVDGSSVLLDSDDEIVAEIIFHSQACPTHSQLTSQGKSTPSQASNPRSPPYVPKGRSSQEKSSTSRLGQRKNDLAQTTHNTPRQYSSGWPPKPSHERHIASAALDQRGRAESSDSCPPMDGTSVHTLTTPKDFPATPPSRSFEPTTPKAMRLDQDFGTIQTSTSDSASGGGFPPMDTLANEMLGIGIARPRSAVW